MIIGTENTAPAMATFRQKSRRDNEPEFFRGRFFMSKIMRASFHRSAGLGQNGSAFPQYQTDQSICELLTNAIRVPSGDHDGTLIVPWPPKT